MIKKVIAASAATGGLLLAGAGTTVADTGAQGTARRLSGILSGNLLQVPLHIPANICGNTLDIVGLLNPAFGNRCANIDQPVRHHHKKPKQHMQEQQHRHHAKPVQHHRAATPSVVTPAVERHQHHGDVASVRPQLAQTGAEGGVSLAIPAAASAGLLLGGVLLYRRGRSAARG